MNRAQSSVVWRLLDLLGAHRAWLWSGAALAVSATLSGIALMAVSGWFITAMALAGASAMAINYFTPAAVIRGLAIVRSGARYGDRLITHEATLRALASLRAWLFRRLIPLAPARLAMWRTGELMARLRADVDALEHFYLTVLVPSVVAAAAMIVVSSVMAVTLPTALPVLVAVAALAGLILPLWAKRAAADDATAAVISSSRLRGLMLDLLRGYGELLAYGAAAGQVERIRQLDGRLAVHRRNVERIQALGSAFSGMLAQIAVILVVAIGLAAVRAGALSSPLLTMLVLLSIALFETLATLPEALANWHATQASAARVFQLADSEPTVSEPAARAAVASMPDIRFEKVRMRYANETFWALDGIDLEVRAGSRVAVVGASGAGKSSLVNVLQKFYLPQSGRVFLDGRSLDQLRGDDVRRRIAVIAQQTTLFDRSLLENLLLAAPDASDAQIDRAVQVAQLEEFVAGLPQGYDTVLGDAGSAVSGGEARRIAIARALLQDAPVLVLDEPTEGLDTHTADGLYASLDEAARGRTLLLITHRLAGLARLVDEVVVMRFGRITERLPVADYLARDAVELNEPAFR